MEMWSEERKRGSGQALVAGNVVRGSKTAAPGQALPRPSVVRGEKLRLWVKRWWREVWSRERNYGLGSNLGGGKCGPWEQNRALGQTLPRPSVVRGSKTVPWVKLCPARVWSRERNCGPGSSPPPPKCGPWEQNRALGQTLPRRSVVQGAKLRPRVTPGPATPSSHLKYKKESKTNI